MLELPSTLPSATHLTVLMSYSLPNSTSSWQWVIMLELPELQRILQVQALETMTLSTA
jgi:hypothetical protein